MNQKQIIFVNVPVILSAVVSVVALALDSINKWWYIIIIVIILLIWQIINMIWLIPKLELIDQYKQLMIRLKKLSVMGSDENRIISEAIKHLSKNSNLPSYKSFEQMQEDLQRKFNKLNNNINSFYRLVYPNTDLIGKEFVEIFIDTKILYKDVSMLLPSECKLINDTYKDFILELKQSRKFDDIKNLISEDLLILPLLPCKEKYDNPY